MKKLLIILIFATQSFYTDAQQYVKTENVFSATTDYNFTNEWQYVSTDLYLFNSSKFNNLLNRINPGKKKGFFGGNKNKDVIKNILVTAQLDGLGDLDALTYPIFNFVVSEDADGNFQAQVAEPEAIRIVDNFPVTSIDDYIGAKISVKIYSDKNKSDLYKFIATQLQSASSLTALSASDAALKAVGEIGNFMQQDAAGNQYQFESTIRFYQQSDFDRQLHSITIFVFQPSFATSNGFNTTDLSSFFDTTSASLINKDILNQLINYNLYPYVVAVNYRSKYKPQISNDVNPDMLRVRKTTNEIEYQNGVRSEEIYIQENSLIDFLYVYSELQNHIIEYERDYDAKITNDFTIQLFIILQNYWKLKNTYKINNQTHTGNPLYENQFKPLYERYLTQAKLKFEGNSSLRAIREHVETIYTLDNEGTTQLDSTIREDFLRKLNTINIPDREINSDEAIVTQSWISKLENEQFIKIYKPQIDFLSYQPIDISTFDKVQLLRLQSANSYCKICKTNVLQFETNFMNSYERYLLNQSKIEYNELINDTKSDIIVYSKKQSCISLNIDSSNTAINQVVLSTLENSQTQLDELIILTNKTSVIFSVSSEYKNEIYKIISLKTSIEAGINSICVSYPQLCDCSSNYNKPSNKTDNDR